MVRSRIRSHVHNAAKLKKRVKKMPEANEFDKLQAVRDLLREGRATEADRQLNDLQLEIKNEEERRKRDMPPPSPRSLAQLQIDFAKAVSDILGNPPRLLNLITEIEGKQKDQE
jgi:ubiquitin